MPWKVHLKSCSIVLFKYTYIVYILLGCWVKLGWKEVKYHCCNLIFHISLNNENSQGLDPINLEIEVKFWKWHFQKISTGLNWRLTLNPKQTQKEIAMIIS